MSQWCWSHHLVKFGSLFDRLNRIICTADVPGCTKIAKNVAFPHGALGVVINSNSTIGEGCVVNAKVTLGSGLPHDGAPTLGSHVWVGVGAFIGGGYFCG